jgi:hypothetical protein
MKNIFLFLLLTLSLGVYAQVDTHAGGIAIPKAKANTTIAPSTTTVSPDNSPFSAKPKEKSDFNLPKFSVGARKDSEFSMFQEEKFVNRSSEYAERAAVKPEGESNAAYRGNQSFGEVRSKSQFVQVMARDFGAEDGDRIKVMVNDRVVVDEIMLDNSFKGIQITLQPGFNKIDFEALNQGTSGPNTAEFRVYDDKENVISSNQWNLATGFKASIMVIKE